MLHYHVTPTDRQPLPPAYATEPRHRGYDAADRAQPYAHYFREQVLPVQPAAAAALQAGPQPAAMGYEVADVATRLGQPGHEPLENGWARTAQGTLFVACLTDMPGVTAAMWDWWFGWHSRESARYKLWHPGAHQFSALGEDRAQRGLTDRQKYIHNVSYVDEYIGNTLNRLAIRFVDPTSLGFAEQAHTTHICARVGGSDLPVTGGWLVHQVRPTAHGAEMRSRFFLGHPQVLDVPAASTSNPAATRVLASRLGRALLRPAISFKARALTTHRTGHDLLEHCASEMNHLASFLPALYAEFRDTP